MSAAQNIPNGTQPTAVVTGGSRGIGKAIAIALARDGFQVLLTYVSRAEEAESVVTTIRTSGHSAWAFPTMSATVLP